MLEKINIADILVQLRQTHNTIAEELLGLICERLAGRELEPISLIEATQLQAVEMGWQPLPKWLYEEVGAEKLLTKYLKEVGLNPKNSDDFIKLYEDEEGEWYADIRELACEVYAR
jgi:hypothetical protein